MLLPLVVVVVLLELTVLLVFLLMEAIALLPEAVMVPKAFALECVVVVLVLANRKDGTKRKKGKKKASFFSLM